MKRLIILLILSLSVVLSATTYSDFLGNVKVADKVANQGLFLNSDLQWENTSAFPTPEANIIRVDHSGGADYLTIQEAIDEIEAVGFSDDQKYLLKVAPGTYTENLTITNIKYLKIEMAGVKIDGTITLTTTQQTGDYYAKIEFVGGASNRPEKGDNAEITGNVTGTRNNDSLIYLSLTGIELSGNLGFTTNGTWVVFMNHCYMSNGSGYLYGDFSGAGSPSVLLETMGLTRLKAHIANTDNSTTEVSLYDVIDTEFDLIDITPSFGGTVRNCEFKSDVTISSGTYEFDNFSYGEAVRQTEDFSGATITFMDAYNGGDVDVVGALTAGSIASDAGVYSVVSEDLDSDTDDVLTTTIADTEYGMIMVRETAGTEICSYLIAGGTIEKTGSDATFTVTKDNAATYNVYFESNVIKIQNKVGDNKVIRIGFYGL